MDEPNLDERVAARIVELEGKPRLTKAEREELEILTYDGPVPRVLPRSDEAPF
jgi:hypothetical protein